MSKQSATLRSQIARSWRKGLLASNQMSLRGFEFGFVTIQFTKCATVPM
jgi:hypothetical protein